MLSCGRIFLFIMNKFILKPKFSGRLVLLFVLSTLFLAGCQPVEKVASADSKVSARVVKVLEEKEITVEGDKVASQLLDVKIEDGLYKNKKVQAQNNNTYVAGKRNYKIGDEVFLVAEKDGQNAINYNVYDYNRLSPLFWLFLFFIVVTVVTGRIRGVTSFIGMACSFLIIFYFVLPQILAGANSFLIAIIAALAIVPLTFYLSHGLNRKTTSAIIGTMLTLLIVGVVATISVDASHLSGSASEEVNALILEKPDVINVKDLLLAGIIISLLGILNDITISQAAIVFKLKEVSPELKFGGLFSKAMDVGRDHIASVVNTLVLVYTGAALPLLLLFLNNPAPFSEILNEEFMAEEILRTLVASIGIVIAVPLTTLITVFIVSRWKGSAKMRHLEHQH